MPAVIAELCRYHPSEVLMNPGMLDCRELTGYIKKNMTCSVELVEEERYAPGLVAISLENQFGRNWDETTSIDKKRSGAVCHGRASGIPAHHPRSKVWSA